MGPRQRRHRLRRRDRSRAYYDGRRWRRGVLAVAILVALVATPSAGGAQEAEGLSEIGTLPALDCQIGAVAVKGPCTMVVDPDRSLGFVAGVQGNGSKHLALYDLERLAVVDSFDLTANGLTAFSEEMIIDAEREIVYLARSYPTDAAQVAEICDGGSVSGFRAAFSYTATGGGTRRLVRLPTAALPAFPCSGTHRFRPLSALFHGRDTLYAAGTSAAESWRGPKSNQQNALKEDDRQALLVRQMTFAHDGRLQLDWEVDLVDAGCGRRHVGPTLEMVPFVERMGSDLIAYCFDARPHGLLPYGSQGYVVRIPLRPNAQGVMMPIPTGGPDYVRNPLNGTIVNYRARRIPSLSGQVTPLGHRETGRLLLVTSDAVNGNAIWVFDPHAERFVGVITGGYADQPKSNSSVGFDAARGRVYLLTKRGILASSVTTDPLPAGLIYPVAENTADIEYFAASPTIAVAPKVGRLVVPVRGERRAGTYPYEYLVVEDTATDPAPLPPVRPDDLTTQIDESAQTEVSKSGQAMTSGAHLVVTGGLARLANQVDPACYADLEGDPSRPFPVEIEPEVMQGAFETRSCVWQHAVANGHRDVYVAAVEGEVGSRAGSTARASTVSFDENDRATGSDLERLGECHRGSLQTFSRGRDPGDQYREGCDRLHDGFAGRGGPDLRRGTNGADGRGFPSPRAECGDYGGGPQHDEESSLSSVPAATASQSAVACDASSTTVRGSARGGALALPDAGGAPVAVATTRSSVQSAATGQGQVTIAFSEASGVQLGPLSIASVRSLAVTRARGRTGTASAVLVRQWCGIAIAGQEIPGCIDPSSPEAAQLVDELNQAVQKVRIGVPEPQLVQTPGGYQAVATKHPAVRGADQAVNDDDSHTVSALQATYFADGAHGRSRVVLQLANVHAESRYGIVELPSFPEPDDPAPPAAVPPTDPAPTPGPVADPGGAAAPAAPSVLDPFTPAGFVEEYSDVTEVMRAGRDTAAPVPAVGGPTGSIGRRIVQVPVRLFRDAIELLVQTPREFALLFSVWALLAFPAYLGARRRAFVRGLPAAP